jgi:glutaredoxin-related protein
MFEDTECPVCLALFSENGGDVEIYDENELIGNMSELKECLPVSIKHNNWEFNKKNGNIGLIAIDNTKTDTIKFVDGNYISSDDVKVSSRAKTRISGDGKYNVDSLIEEANNILKEIRNLTHDVFLTSFKGMREDGKYRRRLDFGLSKTILDCAWERL